MLVMHSVFVHTLCSLAIYYHTRHSCIPSHSYILSETREKEAETVLYSTSVGIVVVKNNRGNSLPACMLSIEKREKKGDVEKKSQHFYDMSIYTIAGTSFEDITY